MGERHEITAANVAVHMASENRSAMTRLKHRLAEAARAEVERQAERLTANPEALVREMDQAKADVLREAGVIGGPRCPTCGHWLSTRYSASQPHQCEPLSPLPKATAPDLSRLPMGPAKADRVFMGGFRLPPPPAAPGHAFKWWARYHGPKNRPTAPAATARALALAWVAGALSGGLVVVLVACLLVIG